MFFLQLKTKTLDLYNDSSQYKHKMMGKQRCCFIVYSLWRIIQIEECRLPHAKENHRGNMVRCSVLPLTE